MVRRPDDGQVIARVRTEVRRLCANVMARDWQVSVP
jgi:hypothetical protein